MYKCNECGCVFEDPKVVVETHGFKFPPYEKFSVCPRCGDGDYDSYYGDEEEEDEEDEDEG